MNLSTENYKMWIILWIILLINISKLKKVLNSKIIVYIYKIGSYAHNPQMLVDKL